ncbi:MAG: hypothetical protein ACR2NP_06595 [Pirellulaceae bacterium]
MTQIASGTLARHNPFATEWTDAIPFRFEQGNWESNLQRLADLQFLAAIVGAKGSGKTTLLENLAEQLAPTRECHYCCFEHSTANHDKIVGDLFRQIECGAILLVDGIERLRWILRRKLFAAGKRQHGGLVVAVHKPCALPLWIECQPDLATLRYVVDYLGFDTNSAVWQESVSAFTRFEGNVRNVLRWLYDQVASGQLVIDVG